MIILLYLSNLVPQSLLPHQNAIKNSASRAFTVIPTSTMHSGVIEGEGAMGAIASPREFLEQKNFI